VVPWPAVPGGLDAIGPGSILRVAGATAAAAALGCGAVIAMRRLSGAIGPAGPGPLVGTAAAGIALVVVADAARRAGAALGVSLAARCGLVLALAALASPLEASGAAGRIAAVLALVAAAVTVVRLPRRGTDGRLRPPERRLVGPGRRRDRSGRRDPRPGILRQRFERRELPAGAERVRGRVVVAVPASARTGYGHLGFCPAFATTPAVDVTTAYDGVEVTVTAAEVLPWGVRVECRLAEPAEEPLEIAVDLVATSAVHRDDPGDRDAAD
jgi:hypothetical protein